MDCFLPNQWFHHNVQAELIAAGIKVPVFKKSLDKIYDDYDQFKSQGIKNDIVYVPHFGDMSIDHIYNSVPELGNPLAHYNQKQLCLLITTPIPGFNYFKFKHGITVASDEFCDIDDMPFDEVVTVEHGYLPHFFREAALKVQDDAIISLKAYAQQSFKIIGAKLNPLNSGKANIVMFILFDHHCPFEQQTYLPQLTNNLKIRIVPNPFITKPNQQLYNLDIVVNFIHSDQGVFNYLYQFANNIITFDLQLQLKHIRYIHENKQLIIVAHSMQPIVLNDYKQKSVVSKIKKASVNYIVKDVQFNVYQP